MTPIRTRSSEVAAEAARELLTADSPKQLKTARMVRIYRSVKVMREIMDDTLKPSGKRMRSTKGTAGPRDLRQGRPQASRFIIANQYFSSSREPQIPWLYTRATPPRQKKEAGPPFSGWSGLVRFFRDLQNSNSLLSLSLRHSCSRFWLVRPLPWSANRRLRHGIP